MLVQQEGNGASHGDKGKLDGTAHSSRTGLFPADL